MLIMSKSNIEKKNTTAENDVLYFKYCTCIQYVLVVKY